MFQIRSVVSKMRLLNGCHCASPAVIVKSNVYNDSIKKPECLFPRDDQPTSSFNDEANIAGPNATKWSVTATPNKHKSVSDWFEEFRRMDFTANGIDNWWGEQKFDMELARQEYTEERHRILGSDLAAATFVASLGGKVRFKHMDDWVGYKKNKVEFPQKFDPKYVLVAVDCSEIGIIYEGLHNLINLNRLEWASFRKNNHFDDWCLDKISANFPSLVYLDVSECKLLTSRGLESLYKLRKLKKIIVTDYGDPDLELVCLMLEECTPDLQFEILPDPTKAKDEAKNK